MPLPASPTCAAAAGVSFFGFRFDVVFGKLESWFLRLLMQRRACVWGISSGDVRDQGNALLPDCVQLN